LVQIKEIPLEFEGQGDYTKSFYKPLYLEIWHNIHLGIVKATDCLNVEPLNYDKGYHIIEVTVPKKGSLPKPQDVFLMTERKAGSRKEILDQSASTTILWVVKVYQPVRSNYQRGDQCVVIKARLSSKPFHFDESQSLNKMPTAVHLTNMTTFSRAWERLIAGLPCCSRMGIIFHKYHVSF
jgi:hypothetical protein